MSATGLETLDHSQQVTHRWINELDAALGWNNKARSYRLLRTVLQALRDCLPLGEIGDLAAQLPVVLRGVFYEQWRPAARERLRWDYDRLLDRIDEAFRKDPIVDTGGAVAVTFALLAEKISAGEIDEVIKALPADIRQLWTARVEAPVR